MSAIVIGILNALIGLIMQILASALEFFADSFLTTIEWDFETFGNYFPFFSNILTFFKIFAANWLIIVGLLFVLKCFGLAAGLQIERSRVWQFIIRYVFFGYLAIQSWGIMSFLYLSIVEIIDEIIEIHVGSDMGFTTFITDLGIRAADGLFISITGLPGTMIGIVKVLVMLVIAVMLVMNFFKLFAVFFLRFIRLVFLVAMAPIAFGMGILEETREIFNTYIRTFFADLFVFIMTAFFIKGFISVMSSSSSRNFDGSVEFADIAYGDLLWAFFALAYSNFAVQFDQFLSSLGVNISRGGGTGGSIIGTIGASAMLLRRAVGHGTSVGSSSVGSTFTRNWNGIKNSVLSGARAGFASGTTPASAAAMAAMGAAKGFASTTNMAKAAEMAKDGSLMASALNDKFAEMQEAAKRNMSQQEYADLKERGERNGFTVDEQRAREEILNDMKAGRLTPEMAQNKLAAHGLLTEDERGHNPPASSQDTSSESVVDGGNKESLAGKYKRSSGAFETGYKGLDGEIHTADGSSVRPNETVRTSDGMRFEDGMKNYPDGTRVMQNGNVQFSNGAVIDHNARRPNGKAYPFGTVLHADGVYSVGNKVYSSDGTMQEVSEPTTLADGTVVQPNGNREINGGAEKGGVTIDQNGVVTHGNGARTVDGSTHHANGSVSHLDGSVSMAGGGVAHLDGSITNSDGSTVIPDGSIAFRDGSVLHSNGDITANGFTKHMDGTVTTCDEVRHGNGAVSYFDGRVSNPDGSIVDGKGNISFDKGETYQPIDGSYTHANGDISYANGSVLHTTGAVSNADGILGSVTHADGTRSVMDGSVLYPNAVVNPDQSIEFDCGVIVKGGAVMHPSGAVTTSTDKTVTIQRSDGSYTEFAKDKSSQNRKTGRERVGRVYFNNGRSKSIFRKK